MISIEEFNQLRTGSVIEISASGRDGWRSPYVTNVFFKFEKEAKILSLDRDDKFWWCSRDIVARLITNLCY